MLNTAPECHPQGPHPSSILFCTACHIITLQAADRAGKPLATWSARQTWMRWPTSWTGPAPSALPSREPGRNGAGTTGGLNLHCLDCIRLHLLSLVEKCKTMSWAGVLIYFILGGAARRCWWTAPTGVQRMPCARRASPLAALPGRQRRAARQPALPSMPGSRRVPLAVGLMQQGLLQHDKASCLLKQGVPVAEKHSMCVQAGEVVKTLNDHLHFSEAPAQVTHGPSPPS